MAQLCQSHSDIALYFLDDSFTQIPETAITYRMKISEKWP